MRDRLIELLREIEEQEWEYAYSNKDINMSQEAVLGRYADYLLENGVIVPPCNVNDVFFGVNETFTDYNAYCVLGFKWGKRRGCDERVLLVLTTYEMEFIWGEEAFLTEEEAERALKGGDKDDR